jgi:hypothetical protein
MDRPQEAATSLFGHTFPGGYSQIYTRGLGVSDQRDQLSAEAGSSRG